MDLLTLVFLTENYQMPRPMSIMPIANHPTTPTEMMVSRVMPESDGFGLGFESESAGFITGKQSVITNRWTPKFEQGSYLLMFEVTGRIVFQVEVEAL